MTLTHLGKIDLLLELLLARGEEKVLLSHVRVDDENRESQKRDDGLPERDLVRRDDDEHDVEPNIGERRVERRGDEHLVVLDAPHLAAFDRYHADGRDHEQIVGRRADYSSRTQVARQEVVTADLDNREQDLRRAAA